MTEQIKSKLTHLLHHRLTRPVTAIGVAAALVAAVALSVGPSMGAFTASITGGGSQTAGVLSMSASESGAGTTYTCSADSSDGFSASCSNVAVATATVPGQENGWSVTFNATGTITSDIHAALTPGSCTGSNSTICADTDVTVYWMFPDSTESICLFGPTGGANGTCGAPTSAYTLSDLAKAGTLPVTGDSSRSWSNSSYPGMLYVTFELSPNATSADEGATVSIPLTMTFTAGS